MGGNYRDVSTWSRRLTSSSEWAAKSPINLCGAARIFRRGAKKSWMRYTSYCSATRSWYVGSFPATCRAPVGCAAGTVFVFLTAVTRTRMLTARISKTCRVLKPVRCIWRCWEIGSV